MASIDSPPIRSPNGFIHVLGYTPTEGERGVPITVRIHFRPELADAMYVRLVVGNKAVPTKVRQLPAVDYGRWQLYASAPPFDRSQSLSSTKVLISVQALNEENDILDSVTFGEFSYWAQGSQDRRLSDAGSRLPRLQIPDGPTLRRRSNHIATTSVDRTHFPQSPQRKTRLHRRVKSQSLVRTKNQNGAAQEYAQTPILELVTSLASLTVDWTPAEVAAGRRLVKFSKIQDGRRIIVSCTPVAQEAFCETDSVISCIYREANASCYVTSVDVIYLLERLTNGEFPVEEKNRIRRNLEGLRPTTVSKHKSGFGDFFQRIMEFPDPKPRNIEKDLKVFEWNLLGQALEKILSKYSIYTSGPDADGDAGEGQGADSTPSSSAASASPELYATQLAYPPPDDATTAAAAAAHARALSHAHPMPVHAKFEPFGDDFALPPTGSAGGAASGPGTADPAFASPVDSVLTAASSSASSSCAAFPLFAPDGSNEDTIGAAAAGAGGGGGGEYWGGGFKAEMPADPYGMLGAYDASVNGGGGAIHPFGDGPALDFDLYDYPSFSGILADEAALAGLGEQYM